MQAPDFLLFVKEASSANKIAAGWHVNATLVDADDALCGH
jgi:hypothetical protein